MITMHLFSPEQIELIARTLAEYGSNRDINDTFARLNIMDLSSQSTKWRRLNWAFRDSQGRTDSDNQVLDFIAVYLDPVKFTERTEEFQKCCGVINEILALFGLRFGPDGKFHPCAETVAPERAASRPRPTQQQPNARIRPAEPPGPRLSHQEIKNRLIGENGIVCSGCARHFDDPGYLEVDHNTPRSDGGIDHISNRILLCSPCNRIKSNTLTLSGLRRENQRRGRMAEQINPAE